MPLRLRDIDRAAVLTALDSLAELFRTKDVSEPAALLEARASLGVERQYHAVLGKYLRKHGDTLGVELVSAAPHPRGALWRKAAAVVLPAPPSSCQAVRPGHYQSLDWMETAAFREIKTLLEAQPEIGGVYFRPLEHGVCMVDLHPGSPKPRIGIGADPLLKRGTDGATIAPSLPERIAYLLAKRAQQSAPSRENQLEARLIREAQANGLRLPPPFPPSLRFVHSQWRVDKPWPGAHQRFTDLTAVDLDTGGLVIVELKAQPDASAAGQVRAYVAYFRAHAPALTPFFGRLARVMGTLYGCPELADTALSPGRIAALTAWPETSGLVVTPVDTPTDALAAPGPEAKPDAQPAVAAFTAYGPQYAGDPPFRARMRFHQSWWRAEVLRVPCGTGPTPASAASYGNMLPAEAAARGLNFLTDEIFAVAAARLAERTGAVEGFRPLHNLLSSQALAFNLFGPLTRDPALATRLLRALLPAEVETVTRVALEYAPQPRAEYLGDRTAFDAFVAYRRPHGSDAFLGIEVKLADTFSPTPYDTPRYRALTERVGSPWKAEARPLLADGRWNQLWRDHLLVEALATHPRAPHGRRGSLLVVHHPEDREAAAAVERYATLLAEPSDGFRVLTLDRLVEAWLSAATTEAERHWLLALRRRYLDLRESEAVRGGRPGGRDGGA